MEIFGKRFQVHGRLHMLPASGMTAREIASECHCSLATVYSVARAVPAWVMVKRGNKYYPFSPR